MYKEIMCDFDNIYEAYKLAHSQKTNSTDVIEFDKNKLYNLNIIHKQLLNKEWDKLFRYYRFKIYEPKERIIDAMEFEGRIVQHILCDKILKPYFEPKLIKENCACREYKGTDYALNLVKQDLISYLKHNEKGYILKIDVHKFFPSINREVLKSLLVDFPDKEIKELLYYLIDTSPDNNGIPIGNQSSQWFALYYLNTLDRIIKEKYHIKYYARYMDDLIIIHEDKQYLKLLLNDLTNVAQKKLKLTFNEKTQIVPIKNGFTFLGWRFYVGKNNKIIMKVSNEKRKLRIKHIKEVQHLSIEEQNEHFVSLVTYLKKGSTYKFHKSYGVEVYPMDKEPECGWTSDIIGNIVWISEVKINSNNKKWCYIKVEGKTKGQKVKFYVRGDQVDEIIENYHIGNLVHVNGYTHIETYNTNNKLITEVIITPLLLEELNNETKEDYIIQLEYEK